MDRAVRDLYWDGDTLVVEFFSGEIYHFEAAYISDINFGYEEAEELKITPVSRFENFSIKLGGL